MVVILFRVSMVGVVRMWVLLWDFMVLSCV